MKEYKLWTVVWDTQSKEAYGIKDKDNPLIMIDESLYSLWFNVSNKKIGRPKWRTATTYPFFETKKEADAFREGNGDFISVLATVTIQV